MIKKILIVLTILLAAAALLLFIYRYQILKYSTETLIRKALPDYIKIEKILFQPERSRIVFENFKILNPPGFSYQNILEIKKISCGYKMKGNNILDGLEMLEPVFQRPLLTIERLADGRTNIIEFGKYFEGRTKTEETAPAAKSASPKGRNIIGNKKISDILKLPETFAAKEGRAVFIDRIVPSRPHMITFDNINATLSLELNGSYTRVLALSSKGSGNLNENNYEIVTWDMSLDPKTPRLTMSNRFDISGADIISFQLYYDKYCPLAFKQGKFSGTLVFDFDNGSIGSTNVVRLSNLIFSVKPGFENAQFWETNVPDLVKYFSSPSGEIVFDFKIKGDMSKPEFYLGPISKSALTAMAIDKISNTLERAAKQGQEQLSSVPDGAKTNLNKAINIFKQMIKKK